MDWKLTDTQKKALQALGINVLMALGGVVVNYDWVDLLGDPKITAIVTALVIPLVNGWLHSRHV